MSYEFETPTEVPSANAPQPGDVRQLLQVASETTGPDERLEQQLRAAYTTRVEAELRARVAAALAAALRRRGLDASAVLVLERCVEHLRGAAPRASALARTNLASAYAQREREVEALVLHRTARRLAQGASPGETVRNHVACHALLVTFHAWEPARLERFAIEKLLPELALAERDWYESQVAGFRLEESMQRGAWAEAMHQAEVWMLLRGDADDSEAPRRWNATMRGHALLELGRIPEAEGSLSAAMQLGAPRDRLVVQATILRAAARIRRGDRVGALADVHAALPLLRDPCGDLGADFVRHQATVLGVLLLEEIRDPALAHDALVLAASAHAMRLIALDEAFRSLNHGRDVEPADIDLLAECRHHAEKAVAADLARVARAFERVLGLVHDPAAMVGAGVVTGAYPRRDKHPSRPIPQAVAGPPVSAAYRASVQPLIRPRAPFASLCCWCGRVAARDKGWMMLAEGVALPPDVSPAVCLDCEPTLTPAR